MKSLCAAVLAVGFGIGMAPPAGADETEYVAQLQARYVYLSAEQLVTEGQKACQLIRTGRTAADAVGMVVKDLGIGVSAANDIVVAAAGEFDC